MTSLGFKLMTPLAGAAVAVALLALSLLATTGAFGARSKRSPRCTVRGHSISGIPGSHVLSLHGQVILYRTRGRLFDRLWACTRGQGRGAAIGRDESYQAGEDEYGAELTLGPAQVAGNWVMVTQERGSAQEVACSKYMITCTGRSDTLVIGNATTGLTARLAHIVTAQLDAGGSLQQTLRFTRALLSPSGAAVWLEESRSGALTSETLFGCLTRTAGRKLTCSAQKLAEGQIDSRSLQLVRATASWMQAGRTQSATIQ